jgi:hypothetical protein
MEVTLCMIQYLADSVTVIDGSSQVLAEVTLPASQYLAEYP